MKRLPIETQLHLISRMKNKTMIREGMKLRQSILEEIGVDILSPNKKGLVPDGRKIFCDILFSNGFSKAEIARFLGHNHSSVIFALQNCEDMLDTSGLFERRYNDVKLNYGKEFSIEWQIPNKFVRGYILELQEQVKRLSLQVEALAKAEV